jgi:hypothetical protein
MVTIHVYQYSLYYICIFGDAPVLLQRPLPVVCLWQDDATHRTHDQTIVNRVVSMPSSKTIPSLSKIQILSPTWRCVDGRIVLSCSKDCSAFIFSDNGLLKIQKYPLKRLQKVLCRTCAFVNAFHCSRQNICLGGWSRSGEVADTTIMRKWKLIFVNVCEWKVRGGKTGN